MQQLRQSHAWNLVSNSRLFTVQLNHKTNHGRENRESEAIPKQRKSEITRFLLMFSPNLVRHRASCFAASASGSLSLGPSTRILDIPGGGWSWSGYPVLPARQGEREGERGRDREGDKERGERKRGRERQRGPRWHLASGNDFLRSFCSSDGLPHLQHSLICTHIYFLLSDAENFLLF